MAFTAGPAQVTNDRLLFNDITNNRILAFDPSGRIAVFRQPSNYANGLVFDRDGRLVSVECGDPAAGTPARVARSDIATGAFDVLVEPVEGHPLRGPDGVTVDGRRRI